MVLPISNDFKRGGGESLIGVLICVGFSQFQMQPGWQPRSASHIESFHLIFRVCSPAFQSELSSGMNSTNQHPVFLHLEFYQLKEALKLKGQEEDEPEICLPCFPPSRMMAAIRSSSLQACSRGSLLSEKQLFPLLSGSKPHLHFTTSLFTLQWGVNVLF